MYKSQTNFKPNETLDGINEEGSYIEGSETYNNSTIETYNNTQPSMGYSNDNEDIEIGRGGRQARYLPHN